MSERLQDLEAVNEYVGGMCKAIQMNCTHTAALVHLLVQKGILTDEEIVAAAKDMETNIAAVNATESK